MSVTKWNKHRNKFYEMFVPDNSNGIGDGNDRCCCGLQQSHHVAFPELRASPPPAYHDGSRAVSASVVPPGSGESRSDPTLVSYPKSRQDAFLEVQWNAQDHIRELPTDSYGMISYDDESLDTIHYVRLSEDSQIAYLKGGSDLEVLRLLRKYWSFLEPHWPNLVISITGDTLAAGIEGAKREKLIAVLIKIVVYFIVESNMTDIEIDSDDKMKPMITVLLNR
ncbi:uncharacterized protein [Palaemon carinicauda]|uniref:uncharacterized protein n=1 Tax=Palaemon carinicauda TaxID=392227 RepID=UPI0035B5ECF5